MFRIEGVLQAEGARVETANVWIAFIFVRARTLDHKTNTDFDFVAVSEQDSV